MFHKCPLMTIHQHGNWWNFRFMMMGQLMFAFLPAKVLFGGWPGRVGSADGFNHEGPSPRSSCQEFVV